MTNIEKESEDKAEGKCRKCEGENEITVDKMELLSSFEWLERPPMVEEIETIDEEEDTEPQVRPINCNFK